VDSHSILNRWKNNFCQLLHIRDLNGVRQTDIHTAEPLVPKPKAFEVQNANKKSTTINHQVLINYQQKVQQYAPMSINLFIPFAIRTDSPVKQLYYSTYIQELSWK
jgi:hypothetical protein